MTSGVQRRDSNVRNSENEINLHVDNSDTYITKVHGVLVSSVASVIRITISLCHT